MTNNGYHVPVLFKESIEALNIPKAGVVVDVTFGGGGHSREILNRLGKKGVLVSFDPDERDGEMDWWAYWLWLALGWG